MDKSSNRLLVLLLVFMKHIYHIHKHKARYANVDSAAYSIFFNQPPGQGEVEINDEDNEDDSDSRQGSNLLVKSEEEFYERSRKQPNLYRQYHPSDLVRDLGLVKDRTELLTSKLKENNLLAPNKS